MVSNGIRKPGKIMIKKLATLLFFIAIVSCSNESSNIETSSIEKAKTYNWRLVTAWPKNYPGLGMAPERIA